MGWRIGQAVELMDACDRDVLGVVDDQGRFVGLVTTTDLMRLDEILGRSEVEPPGSAGHDDPAVRPGPAGPHDAAGSDPADPS